MSAGGGSEKSSSSSIDKGTNVWGPQQPYLKDIYGQAQNIYGTAGNQAAQGAYDQSGQYQQAFGQAMETTQRLQNPGMNPMMNVYANQIGQNFREQIMPALQGQAMQAGGYGGSRAGIAQGLAGARAGQQIQDFGAQLYSEDQNRALSAAGMQGQLGQMGGQYALDRGAFGMGIPWYNLQQYSGLIGAPTMQDLGGSSTSKSSGWNANAGLW